MVGYKSIYINTYNVVVNDLSSSVLSRCTLHRHECFQLWESSVSGILLTQSKNYVTFSKEGMHVIALGNEDKKLLDDQDGNPKILHSLDSLNFLKCDQLNFLNFRCQ